MNTPILVTGGAGFIGSHLVDFLIKKGHDIVVLDKLTYAGHLSNLSIAQATEKLEFIHGDICDTDTVFEILQSRKIKTVFHLAAESHVDNSIHDPDTFITTNIIGTLSMLKAAHAYWKETGQMETARFIHVSTDEVFGHLGENDRAFHEDSSYKPNSPYSASKAASDHFVRAWHRTYGIPVIITNCSNNFGPRQHPEKLIPTILRNALNEKPIPIYGTGNNIRDWLYVEDHCEGLYLAFLKGQIGQSYAFGGNNEIRNIEMAKMLCRILDSEMPRPNGEAYENLISLVEDRKGHDWRYAIATDKVEKDLGFYPKKDYKSKFMETTRYYISKSSASSKDLRQEDDLEHSTVINLAAVNFTYESFREIAKNPYLSSHERVGFPDSYREGFIPAIVHDIISKLDIANKQGGAFLDIGCGASDLTSMLLEKCSNYHITGTLVDCPEMLQCLDSSKLTNHYKVAGKFPDVLDQVMAIAPKGYEAILCYSVLQCIIRDHNIFDFIDTICMALKPQGTALIGDIPNQSKRKRFFSTDTGINFHKSFMKTASSPVVEHYKINRNTIDESVLNGLIERARFNGCHAYLLPQPNSLPMANRRDDLLIQKI